MRRDQDRRKNLPLADIRGHCQEGRHALECDYEDVGTIARASGHSERWEAPGEGGPTTP